MKASICASVMCADQFNLQRDVEQLILSGVDYLHLDIMDGVFVPNITLGIDVCNCIKNMSDVPIDVHMLVDEPEAIMKSLMVGEGDILSVHGESRANMTSVAQWVHSRKALFGIALNPETEIDYLLEILDCVDVVNLMMIEPGFAGRKMKSGMISKIERTRRFLDNHGLSSVLIQIDGNVSFEHASAMRAAGGDLFVAGSSSIFSAKGSIANNIDEFRRVLLDESASL